MNAQTPAANRPIIIENKFESIMALLDRKFAYRPLGHAPFEHFNVSSANGKTK